MAWTKISVLALAFLIGSCSAKGIKTRIFNGNGANIEDYPYQASIRVSNVHMCGGSIISERHILTAAHCFIKFLTPFYVIYTGTSFSNDTGNVHPIQKIDIHPGWTFNEDDGFKDDIAIVTLKHPIVFNNKQQKISLPVEDIKSGTNVNLTGWGLTGQNPDVRPLELQLLKTHIITSDQCHTETAKITAKQICTQRESGTGPCHGDSGGPLAADGAVVGIVSWVDNEDSCATGSPEVYTKVYDYLDYIKSVIDSK